MSSSLLPVSAALSQPGSEPAPVRRLRPATGPAPTGGPATSEAPASGLVVVAGADGAAPGSVLAALLGVADLPTAFPAQGAPLVAVPATPDDPEQPLAAPSGGGAAPQAGPPIGGHTWVVARAGAQPRITAHVPGGRTAVAAHQVGPRPPRRIEVEHPAPLLASVAVAVAPRVDPTDDTAVGLLVDTVGAATGMIFMTTAEPFDRPQLDLLRRLAAATDRIAVVVMDDLDQVTARQVVAAKHAALAGHVPALAGAPWFAVTRAVGAPAAVTWTAAPPALARPAGQAPAGTAGPDVGDLAALRDTLRAWHAATPAGVVVPRQRGGAPVAADDQRWREALDREAAARRTAAGRRITEGFAGIGARCARELSAGRGCSGLPALLDLELHALSVRLGGALEDDAAAITGAVGAALFGEPQSPPVLGRLRDAARRAVEVDEDTRPPRALLVTVTAGVAGVRGADAVDNCSATGLPARAEPVLAPIGVAVNPSCYRLWQHRDPQGVLRAKAWLSRALLAMETAVQRECDRRFDELVTAVGTVAADAVDHGVLLG